MIEGVIFDIDGTLVDSVDLHAETWRQAFLHFGFDFPFARVRSQIGKGSDQLLPALLPKDVVKERGKEIDEYRGKLFHKEYFPRVTAFPAVRDLFERIRADGKRIALASSAKPEDLEVYERITRIGDLIETSTSSGDVDKSKPHPDILLVALERLDGIDPSRVAAVGDTPYDAEAAGKAGLLTVGVLCGGWSESDLKGAGCVAVFRDPADLLARYEQSPLA